jgi:hypothetical protein
MLTERCNVPERKFEELAERLGLTFTKRGWPDFMCFTKDGEMIAVEVKPRMTKKSGTRLLKREQAKAMEALTACGIRCFVSDGETMEPFNPEIHAQESRRYSRHRFAAALDAKL